jgi:hypothetical protein
VAYAPKGAGPLGAVVGAVLSHNSWVSAGTAVLGGLIETFAVWWDRNKKRWKARDDH